MTGYAPALNGYHTDEYPAPAAIRKPYVTSIVGTPQQEAFWTAIINGRTHIVLIARAGTGKTFSVIEAARRALWRWPRLRVGFSAFNSHIAKELQEKVPQGCTAFTLHGLGFQAIIKHLGYKPDIESGKVKSLLESLAEPGDRNRRGTLDKTLWRACRDLVSLCKAHLYEGTPQQLAELVLRFEIDMMPNLPSLGSDHGIPSPFKTPEALRARAFELVPRLLQLCRENLSVIDFDDQIWLPVVLNLPLKRFDLLFVDEVQDLNTCQQEMVFKVCPIGRIVIVGDPAQSIYAFRGADVKAMGRLSERLADTERGRVEMPLTYTRRCPKKVVELARAIVPDIEAMPDAPEGEIHHIELKALSETACAGDMILCRCNAPLVAAAHSLMRQGKKALLKGKDFSGQIRELIRVLDASNIHELQSRLMAYQMAESDRLEEAGTSASVITAHVDRCQTLKVLMEGCKATHEIENRIKAVFDNTDDKEAVVLSSVHGAKGLEADRVFIVAPDLMPHPSATSDIDIEQEMNIKYVCLTRAKQQLFFVYDDKKAVAAAQDSPWGEHHGENPDGPPFGDEYADDDTIPEVTTDLAEEFHNMIYAPAENVQAEVVQVEIPQSWQDIVRGHLQMAFDKTPFDQADLSDWIKAALEAVPR